MPIHAEGRLSYHFSGLGEGFGPYVGLSGGMAQFDLKVPATIRNCDPNRLPVAEEGQSGNPTWEQCYYAGTPGSDLLSQQQKDALPQLGVDVYQKNGPGFVWAHVGAAFRFSVDMGLQANVNLVYTLPKSTLIIEPTLGFIFGL
jgi:hypothetical protein